MTGFTASWPALLSILAGVASMVLARWVWRFRERPGAIYWTGVQISIAVWSLTYGVALLTFDPTIRRLFEPLLWLSRSMAPPLVFLFALDYTGRDRLVSTRFRRAIIGFWILATLLHWTNFVHHLSWTDYHIAPIFGAAAVDFTPGIGLYVTASAAWIFNGTAAGLILGPLLSKRQLFGRQAVAIIVVIAFPTIANVLWLFRLGPTAHLDLTPIMFLVTTAGMSYALFREELFELLPATTRIANDIAIDDINAAIVTVSPDGRLIDLNSSAAVLFDVVSSKTVGQSIDDVFAVEIPLESTEFTISDPGGNNRDFDVDVSPIESTTGDPVGHVLTFYDITEERRRQQRLAVQNRILRHNLRNGMNVIDGYAERIGQVATEEEAQTFVENIRRKSDELIQVGEKAQRFDRALSDDTVSVDVVRLCRDVVDDLSERYPAAEIRFTADTSPEVTGRERLLRQIVVETIENGIVHDPSERPRIDLRVESTPDRVTITVEDDGPGIPAYEIDALQSGDEDPLSHGSGIGLWIVEWGTSILGGSVAFESDESDGTTVSIHLPRD